ncbi:MAG: hypothetical protein R3C08_00625 [Hyphomonas sp.]
MKAGKMSDPNHKKALSVGMEGLIGGIIGTVLGVILWRMGVISMQAIPGVTAGLGFGSWFNAWRRERKAEKDKGE